MSTTITVTVDQRVTLVLDVDDVRAHGLALATEHAQNKAWREGVCPNVERLCIAVVPPAGEPTGRVRCAQCNCVLISTRQFGHPFCSLTCVDEFEKANFDELLRLGLTDADVADDAGTP